MNTVLVIPALNEEETIGRVLAEVPEGLFHTVLVVDNGSTDQTGDVAASHGALVVSEPRRGYGSACICALEVLPAGTRVVVFMDGDGSHNPADARSLLQPILEGQADMVLGSRVLGDQKSGILHLHQRIGNRIATSLLAMLMGHSYSDLGPFRAIRADSLEQLGMCDAGYGWTVEMQIKALQHGLRVAEVAVENRQRMGGVSKVSGSLRGSLAAGCKILWTLARNTMHARN